MLQTPQTVLEFWFEKLVPQDWFVRNEAIDREISEKFLELHLELSRNVDDQWRETPDARLALIIALDQFPRNIFRGSPHAFATDGLALTAAKAAIGAGADRKISAERRIFFYMPFEHAEDLEEQNRSVELFAALGNETYLDYAKRHREVIETYGRFPHRNAIVGRQSTPEEEIYLSKPGAGF